ncbi:hypothetical protein BN1723_010404 [Verticillium longisporum]|uniref:Uncharacterized protein n=1 Tax=Verticillium longisporum TaxID=100787 RepID=A0A0G4KXX8_VERLO
MAPPPSGWASLPTEIRFIIWQYCISTELLLISRKIYFEVYDLVWRNTTFLLKPHTHGKACQGPAPDVREGAAACGCICPGGGDMITEKKMLGIVTSVRKPISDSFFDLDYTPDPTTDSTTMTTLLPFDRLTQLDVGECHAMLQPFITDSWADVFPHLQTLVAHTNFGVIFVEDDPLGGGRRSAVRARLTQRVRDEKGRLVVPLQAIRLMRMHAVEQTCALGPLIEGVRNRVWLADTGFLVTCSWNEFKMVPAFWIAENLRPRPCTEFLTLTRWRTSLGRELVMDLWEWQLERVEIHASSGDPVGRVLETSLSWSRLEMRERYGGNDPEEGSFDDEEYAD